MVVVRFARLDDRLVMSRPCSRCVELLKIRHIHMVVYSDHDGKLVYADVATMRHTPSSLACKIPSVGRVVSYSKLCVDDAPPTDDT